MKILQDVLTIYGTEYIFMDAMKKELTQAFPELKISCAEVKSPYTIL